MVDEYYQVRRKDSPDENGIVVRLSRNILETFAGSSAPCQYGCFFDPGERLQIDSDYEATHIPEEEAKRLREDYIKWEIKQAQYA